jgi:serine/threonine protein kinase
MPESPPTCGDLTASDSPPVPLVEPPAASVPGYEILEVLGRGGMGVVYKARHLRLNRIVALKMVLHGGHAGPQEHVRFLQEAETIAAIRHAGVVQVYDFGAHGGLPYLALEFCDAGSLAQKLSGKPLPPREATRLVGLVAEAVQAAHDAGIVHRDLKPANVLLTTARHGDSSTTSLEAPASGTWHHSPAALPREMAKVTDFGLARRLEGGSGMTQTGQVMGTPSYVAPEQALSTKNAGPAADVYALGAILYECLTGRPPFLAATPIETLRQVLSDEPPAPRSLAALAQPGAAARPGNDRAEVPAEGAAPPLRQRLRAGRRPAPLAGRRTHPRPADRHRRARRQVGPPPPRRRGGRRRRARWRGGGAGAGRRRHLPVARRRRAARQGRAGPERPRRGGASARPGPTRCPAHRRPGCRAGPP